MRRRWLIWVAVSVAAALVIFLGLAVLLGQPPGGFAFLRGHEPLPQPQWQFYGPHSKVKISVKEYSFEADFDVLGAAARKELLALGYHELTPLGQGTFMYFSSEPPSVSTRPGGWVRSSPGTVIIHRDMRYVEQVNSAGPKPEKGWVMVSVAGNPPKTFFDKAREWIGL